VDDKVVGHVAHMWVRFRSKWFQFSNDSWRNTVRKNHVHEGTILSIQWKITQVVITQIEVCGKLLPDGRREIDCSFPFFPNLQQPRS